MVHSSSYHVGMGTWSSPPRRAAALEREHEMTAQPRFAVRKLKFDDDESIPKYWHGGRRSLTIFLDGLSILFPKGERFFIQSVRAHEHLVTDPQLRADIRAFIGQEGFHGREHQRYNDRLRRHGYRVNRLERETGWLLACARSVFPKRSQLATTAALEHFTAILANQLLSNPRLSEGAHPVMKALWHWHAAEETEHKSVAFDVYKLAGGNYVERTAIMLTVSAIFIAKVIEHQIVMMHDAGIVFSGREWANLGKWLFVEPGGLANVIVDWLAYMRPGFHPNDFDASHLLQAWTERFSSTPEYKNG